ncbi:MAG: hypothetical protein EPO06_03990 [Burkholderiaceae bacterium]|nr:MAG: hypothetical protein EPO06_03990 [Burkholderiaceae bacterium]
MRNILIGTAVATLLASAAFSASAENTSRIDRREANQERRIEQGEKSGALTPREANRLEHGQQHVENMETRAEADGKVTAKERAHIEHAQDVQSRHIYEQKHDRQHDFNHDGKVDHPRHRK